MPFLLSLLFCLIILGLDIFINTIYGFPQPCHVVYTDYRPIPLQHYIFPAGGDGLHLVVDENVRHIISYFGNI